MLFGDAILILHILKGWLLYSLFHQHVPLLPPEWWPCFVLCFVKKALGSTFCHGLVIQNLSCFLIV